MELQKHKIISIVNQKGGVGKTTTALNMAAWLSLFTNAKILLIDMDGQANLTACVNIDKSKINGTSFDLLVNEDIKAENVIYKNKNLLFDMIVADDKLNNIDIVLNNYIAREMQLLEKLEEVKNNYDYIIIDCSPSLNLATINSLAATDYVMIPVQADFLSVRGTAKLLESIERIKNRLNTKLDILGVFITMYDNRKLNDKEIYDTIQEQFKEKAFKTCIRENVKLKESPIEQKSIFEYDKASNGYYDYYSLMIEVWKRLGGNVSE